MAENVTHYPATVEMAMAELKRTISRHRTVFVMSVDTNLYCVLCRQ